MSSMDIDDYHSSSAGVVTFTEQQASDFAKGVAGDFNPIHDPGSKRFCVPGDLLFALMLHRYGVASTTMVEFAGMLTADGRLSLPSTIQGSLSVKDHRDREVLTLRMDGQRYNDPQLVKGIISAYVKFSGKTFPDVLVPLMQESNVMINPQRPLVIYKDMSLSLLPEAKTADTSHISLMFDDASLQADGRKGSVALNFNIDAGDIRIGRGTKNMVLSGLREFDEAAMHGVVDEYNTRRETYQAIEN